MRLTSALQSDYSHVWIWPRLVLMAMVLGMGCSSLSALEDGVYPTNADNSLGQRLGGSLPGDSLCSQDNANTEYLLSVRIPAVPGVVGFHHVVVLNGRALPVVGVSILDQGEDISVRLDASACAAAERLFALPAYQRSHPGYLIDGSFTPEHATFMTGERMPVRFQLRNVGGQAFAFTLGGRNRGLRDNQFDFSGTSNNNTALVPTIAYDHGGLASTKIIAPGATYEVTVDLASWFPHAQPGTYALHGSFSFEIPEPSTHQTRWEDTLTRDFTLQVVPAGAASTVKSLDR